MDSYHKGLNGLQAIWATESTMDTDWVLPNDIMQTLEAVGKA